MIRVWWALIINLSHLNSKQALTHTKFISKKYYWNENDIHNSHAAKMYVEVKCICHIIVCIHKYEKKTAWLHKIHVNDFMLIHNQRNIHY